MWKTEDIQTLNDYFKDKNNKLINYVKAHRQHADFENFQAREDLNSKISLFKGSITDLEIDAVVNAANKWLRGGGGVDGAIHSAAGRTKLLDETERLYPNGCKAGKAVITSGFDLPAKYIIHTVGPTDGDEITLMRCYLESLKICVQKELRTVAFCCIATGIYGFPNDKAAQIAIATARAVLEKYADKFDRIIFCVFLDIDQRFYEKFLSFYFPITVALEEEKEEVKKSDKKTSRGRFFALAKKYLNDEEQAWDPDFSGDDSTEDRDSPQGQVDSTVELDMKMNSSSVGKRVTENPVEKMEVDVNACNSDVRKEAILPSRDEPIGSGEMSQGARPDPIGCSPPTNDQGPVLLKNSVADSRESKSTETAEVKEVSRPETDGDAQPMDSQDFGTGEKKEDMRPEPVGRSQPTDSQTASETEISFPEKSPKQEEKKVLEFTDVRPEPVGQEDPVVTDSVGAEGGVRSLSESERNQFKGKKAKTESASERWV